VLPTPPARAVALCWAQCGRGNRVQTSACVCLRTTQPGPQLRYDRSTSLFHNQHTVTIGHLVSRHTHQLRG